MPRRQMLLALIGDPVEHSLSPALHTTYLCNAGIEGSYQAFRVARGQVALSLRELNERGFFGVNVTTPHKEEVLALALQSDESVRAIGSVNTLIASGDTWRASNTDHLGAQLEMEQALGGTIHGSRILVLGTGPTGRAVCYAAAKAGARVRLWSRESERASSVAARLGVMPLADTAEFDLVYATLPPNPSLPDEVMTLLKSANVIIDANYGARSTLHELVERPIIDGLGMLKAQAEASFRLWLEAFRLQAEEADS